MEPCSLAPDFRLFTTVIMPPSFFFFNFFGGQILVPQSGIEPIPLAVKTWSPNHWTTKEVPNTSHFNLIATQKQGPGGCVVLLLCLGFSRPSSRPCHPSEEGCYTVCASVDICTPKHVSLGIRWQSSAWCFHHHGLGSVPGQGTETPRAAWLGQKYPRRNTAAAKMLALAGGFG